VVVFELDELAPLDEPVENDAGGVRGARYDTANDLRVEKTLSVLRDCAAS
jgi:hypothetical protein